MSSSQTSLPDRQLLAIGKQCSHKSCGLVDFLPFKCQHCQDSFCQEHFMVQSHSCPEYDESKHNRVAPNCPMCNEPVAIPPGMNPNVRMDTHLTRECSVMTGKAAKKSVPVCAREKCSKVLYAPIKCTTCHQQFCPSHRFPKDHTCSTPATSAALKPSSSKPAPQRSNNLTAGSHLLQLNNKASSAGAAIKKSINSATTAAQSSTSNTPSISVNNPFSKTESAPTSSPVLIPKPVVRPITSFAPPPIFVI